MALMTLDATSIVTALVAHVQLRLLSIWLIRMPVNWFKVILGLLEESSATLTGMHAHTHAHTGLHAWKHPFPVREKGGGSPRQTCQH